MPAPGQLLPKSMDKHNQVPAGHHPVSIHVPPSHFAAVVAVRWFASIVPAALLLLGIIFMFLAIYPVTRELLGPVWNLVLFLGVLALLVVAQLLLRRYVSGPRIGYAEPRRSPKLRRSMTTYWEWC